MPLDTIQRQHLESLWRSADERLRDEAKVYETRRLTEARKKNNIGALGPAYIEAALWQLETQVNRHLDLALESLADMGVRVDVSVEKFLSDYVQMLTSRTAAIRFASRSRLVNEQAVQSSYAQSRMQKNVQLRREAANRIRAARLRVPPVLQSAQIPPEIIRKMEELSIGQAHLTKLLEQVANSPNKRTALERTRQWFGFATQVARLAHEHPEWFELLRHFLHSL